MTWFKENKFLAGLLIFTLVGAGVLGYLMMTSKSKYEESASAFQQQSTELHRLETLPAYPDKDNLEVLESQRQAHLSLIDDLQKSLAAAQIPMEPITPNGFQDQLRVAVTAFTTKAGAAAPPIGLPAGFYLGFGPYQSVPPSVNAAAPLARELKVIQMIAKILLENKISTITRFDREALPEEKGATAAPAATPKPGPGAKPAGKPAEPLLKAHALDIQMVVEQKSLEGILNALVKNTEQFLIVRYINIHNQADRGPQRSDPTAPAAPTTDDPNPKPKSPMLFGEEKIDVLIHLEIVDFNKPEPAASGNRNAGK